MEQRMERICRRFDIDRIGELKDTINMDYYNNDNYKYSDKTIWQKELRMY